MQLGGSDMYERPRDYTMRFTPVLSVLPVYFDSREHERANCGVKLNTLH